MRSIVLREISHPNLAALQEAHEVNASVFLVFEFYEGGDLLSMAKAGNELSEHQVTVIIKGVLRGLAYLAELSLVHRDVKPANVMLRKQSSFNEGDVVLIDFGFGTSLNQTDQLYRRCGTPGYVAPEVISLKAADEVNYSIWEKCDVFSAGVLLYFLCTKQNPFEDSVTDAHTVMRKNKEASIFIPSWVNSKFSTELLHLMKGLTARNPKNRVLARDALNSHFLGGSKIYPDLGTTSQSGHNAPLTDNYSSVGSINSFLRRPPAKKEPLLMDESVSIESGESQESREENNHRLSEKASLYKRSLMKGSRLAAFRPRKPSDRPALQPLHHRTRKPSC